MSATIGAISGKVRAVLTVTIDLAQSPDEMIAAGLYDEVKDQIRGVNFPWKRKGKKQVELTLFQLDRQFAPGEIKKLMAGHGYRPGYIEELLALGKEQPDLQRRVPIVALGSGRIIHGRRYAATLAGGITSRSLGLAVIYRRWSTCYWFVFVKEQ